jgi:hypothetical protein
MSVQLELTHYTFQHIRFCFCGLPRDEQFFYLNKMSQSITHFFIPSLFHTSCLVLNLRSQTPPSLNFKVAILFL